MIRTQAGTYAFLGVVAALGGGLFIFIIEWSSHLP